MYIAQLQFGHKRTHSGSVSAAIYHQPVAPPINPHKGTKQNKRDWKKKIKIIKQSIYNNNTIHLQQLLTNNILNHVLIHTDRQRDPSHIKKKSWHVKMAINLRNVTSPGEQENDSTHIYTS